MTHAQVIRNVRPWGQSATVDLILAGGCIQAIKPPGESLALECFHDGQGQLLLPALVEAHTHLDKTLWTLPWRGNSAGPTRNDRIANEHRVLQQLNSSMAERVGPLIEHCIAQGSLYFRSHVDAQTEWGLQHIQAMVALRSTYAHLVDIQLVAFPQGGLLNKPGVEELMRAALDMGVEVVGGIDPAGIDQDPIGHLRAIFDMAISHTCGVDIHLHDLGELGRWEIERIADMTHASGLQGKVMISHAYALGAFSNHELAPLADRLAALEISIMTCAPAHVSVPPVAMLRAHGVNVCSGSDGIRDAWSPMGNGDMLERAWIMAHRFGWSKDADLRMALDAVTTGGARALGIERYGLEPGCDANFVLLAAENLAEAVVSRSRRRTVISRGRVVARDGLFLRP